MLHSLKVLISLQDGGAQVISTWIANLVAFTKNSGAFFPDHRQLSHSASKPICHSLQINFDIA